MPPSAHCTLKSLSSYKVQTKPERNQGSAYWREGATGRQGICPNTGTLLAGKLPMWGRGKRSQEQTPVLDGKLPTLTHPHPLASWPPRLDNHGIQHIQGWNTLYLWKEEEEVTDNSLGRREGLSYRKLGFSSEIMVMEQRGGASGPEWTR